MRKFPGRVPASRSSQVLAQGNLISKSIQVQDKRATQGVRSVSIKYRKERGRRQDSAASLPSAARDAIQLRLSDQGEPPLARSEPGFQS